MQLRSPVEFSNGKIIVKDPDLAARIAVACKGDMSKVEKYLDEYFSKK